MSDHPADSLSKGLDNDGFRHGPAGCALPLPADLSSVRRSQVNLGSPLPHDCSAHVDMLPSAIAADQEPKTEVPADRRNGGESPVAAHGPACCETVEPGHRLWGLQRHHYRWPD